MHHYFLEQLVQLLAHYGYVVLFPIAVIEGPLAALFAGAFVASGEFDFVAVFFLLVAADSLGDTLYYTLGRFSHRRFLAGFGKKLGITEEKIAPFHEGFRKHDWKLLLLGKTQAFGSIILYFAGATHMPFLRFMGWNLLGTVPKILLFECAGYLLGQSVLHSTKYLNEIGIATFAVGLLLLAGYYLVKRYLEEKLEIT